MIKLIKAIMAIVIILLIAMIGAVIAAGTIDSAVREGGGEFICATLDSETAVPDDDAEKEIKELDPECAIVLGAGITNSETPSHMLKDRLDAGILLYKLGLVPKLLLTGDNGQVQHNEIHVMLNYCLNNGVKSKDIFCDHAGFATYDSMYRAKSIFCIERALVVTQAYHLYRALYLAEGLDIEVRGIASDQRPHSGQEARDAREVLARIKDYFKLKKRPAATYGGKEFPISDDSGAETHGE